MSLNYQTIQPISATKTAITTSSVAIGTHISTSISACLPARRGQGLVISARRLDGAGAGRRSPVAPAQGLGRP
jgi:hypothetical protein